MTHHKLRVRKRRARRHWKKCLSLDIRDWGAVWQWRVIAWRAAHYCGGDMTQAVQEEVSGRRRMRVAYKRLIASEDGKPCL